MQKPEVIRTRQKKGFMDWWVREILMYIRVLWDKKLGRDLYA